MRRSQSWIAAAGAVLVFAAVLVGYKLNRQWASDRALAAATEPAEAIQTARARVAPFAAQVRSVGTVVATQTVDLRNERAGTVTYVGFKSGQVVPKGTVLVRLGTGEEQARLAAQTARAKVATKNLERSRELVDRGFISQSQVDLLVSESRAASADAAAIRAAISKKQIRAPFTGRAGIHDLHSGQYLEEGTKITTLQGVGPRRYVDFTLPSEMAANLGLGSLVRVGGTGLPPGGIDAKVVARDSTTTDARLVKYRISISVAPDKLLPGSFADISVPVGPAAPAVFVPRTAVNQRPHAVYVFVLIPQAKGGFRVRQQVVRLGPVSGDEVTVVSGLKGGERIAADGAFKLRDGMLVEPVSSQ